MTEGTIRELTVEDWPAIEAVIDSRRSLQGDPLTDEAHTKFKLGHVRNRIEREDVRFWGYFLGPELVALSSFHTVFGMSDSYAMGATWTKKGVDLPKWPGTRHYAVALIEVRNRMVIELEAKNVANIWIIGPTDPSWERIVEVKGCYLADEARYGRETFGYLKSGCRTGLPFVDRYILNNGVMHKDQTIFRFWNRAYVPSPEPAVEFVPPPDAPPREAINFNVDHPPRDMKLR